MKISKQSYPGVFWVGLDLDATLAEAHGWTCSTDIGKPIPSMISLVKELISSGIKVKIFTARVDVPVNELVYTVYAIQCWCKKHIGIILPITDRKDAKMLYSIDDRSLQVIPNKGKFLQMMCKDGKKIFEEHLF